MILFGSGNTIISSMRAVFDFGGAAM
eukprot:COSAG01_NODE_6897_length_3447_cov_1.819594_1_plen_25_part_10